MIRQGWKQREANARDKLAERAARDADPAWQAIQAERKAHLFAQQDAERQRMEAEQAQRDAPVRAVIEMLSDKFGDDLHVFAAAVRRVGGMTKVASYLERTLVRHEAEEREASMAERATANSTRARVERAKSTEERRARQEALIAERRAALASGEAAQDAPQAA